MLYLVSTTKFDQIIKCYYLRFLIKDDEFHQNAQVSALDERKFHLHGNQLVIILWDWTKLYCRIFLIAVFLSVKGVSS